MDVTRRRFLYQAGLCSALGLPLARTHAATTAETAAESDRALEWFSARRTVVRRNLADLTADSPEIVLLRDALRVVRERSARNPLDPRGWYAYAQLHSAFCGTNTYEDQVHYGWFFLPWHRGYLATLEQLLQDAVAEPQLALPYWDWTHTPQIPATYAGADNPLGDPTRIMQPGEIIPWDLLDVGPALRAPTWNAFGGHARLDPAAPQIEGCLEQGCHNNVHNWMGGNIASFSGAGYDPIFHTHHGQIDRMWEAWRAVDESRRDPADPRWTERRFFFYDPRGRPIALRVGDMVDTVKLGYRYDSLAFNLNVRALAAYRERPYADDGFAPAGEAVRTPVAVTAASRPALLRALGDPRSRVVLQFERRQLPIHPYCVRIFLGRPEDPVSTNPAAPGFVGTYTYLPIPGLELGLDRHCVTQLEVGAAHADLIRAGGPLVATLVPLQLRDRIIPPQTLSIQNASLRLEA